MLSEKIGFQRFFVLPFAKSGELALAICVGVNVPSKSPFNVDAIVGLVGIGATKLLLDLIEDSSDELEDNWLSENFLLCL